MKKIFTLLFMFSLLLNSSMVFAQEGEEAKIVMTPADYNEKGYFYLKANPGERRNVTVNLKNVSDKYSGTATLFVSDAINSQGGGMAVIMPEEATQKRTGGWFKLKQEEVTLTPGESRDVTLDFTIPSDAKAGDHIANIVLQKFVKAENENDVKGNRAEIIVNRAYSQSIAVLVKLPGPTVHKMELETIEPLWNGKDLFLNMTLINEGNVFEKSQGEMNIYKDGKLVDTIKGNMDSVYPGNSAVFSALAPTEMKDEGTYTINVNWNYANQTITKDFSIDIERKAVKEAEKVEKETVKEPTGAIVLTKKMIIAIVIAAVISIGLAVLITTQVMKRRNRIKE